MKNNKEKEYLYKLIPNLSLFDYAEYLYWTNHSEYKAAEKGNEWYQIYKVSQIKEEIVTNKETFKSEIISTDAYRMMFVSDCPLKFESTDSDFLWYQLENYENRYLYVAFSSDKSDTPDPIKFSVTNFGNDTYAYVTGIRF